MTVSTFIDALQWPAMATTIAAAWCVGSSKANRRTYGFRLFILSNVLWSVWGWNANAYALIILQLGLFVLNARGAGKQAAIQSSNA